MPIKSKRQGTKTYVSKTGQELSACYCRKCQKIQSPRMFYDATDFFLDTNGKMSICMTCINDIFGRIYESELDFYKAALKTCRILNIKYDERAVDAAVKHLTTFESKGRSAPPFFGVYKSRIMAVMDIAMYERDSLTLDMTFHEPTEAIQSELSEDDLGKNDIDYLHTFWGNGMTFEDYDFLERELSDWKATHRADSKAEISLLKELCHKELEIRKKRELGQSTASLVKEKQDLMRTASLDPAKANALNSGKSQDTFSNFIKIIEQNEPADYYKDKSLFKDYDKIDVYWKKYLVRSLRNFTGLSRDFNIGKDEEDSNDDSDFDNIVDALDEVDNG